MTSHEGIFNHINSGKKSQAITIKDIARESGVNISTVSRALNDAYGVHQQTRGHVLAEEARLHLYPNRGAPRQQKTPPQNLTLIPYDIINAFFVAGMKKAECG